MRAVFLDLATIDTGDLSLQHLEAAVSDWRFYDRTDPGQRLARLQGADIVVTNKVGIDRQIIDNSPALKLICIAATGTNNCDLIAAQQRGIAVRNVTAYATASVVQHVFVLILALRTRLNDYQSAVADGQWQRAPGFCLLDFPITELAGSTLGIIGYGELGRAVADVARAFGMQVIVAQRPAGTGGTRVAAGQEARTGGSAGPADTESASAAMVRLPLDDVLATADIVSLHCPLADNTRNLIGAGQLARMRNDALLINTARGGLVDEAALADALAAGRLAGAGIDVLATEPPIDGSPLLDYRASNLIVTPHTAWASRQARQRLLDQVAANIRQWQKTTHRAMQQSPQ